MQHIKLIWCVDGFFSCSIWIFLADMGPREAFRKTQPWRFSVTFFTFLNCRLFVIWTCANETGCFYLHTPKKSNQKRFSVCLYIVMWSGVLSMRSAYVILWGFYIHKSSHIWRCRSFALLLWWSKEYLQFVDFFSVVNFVENELLET